MSICVMLDGMSIPHRYTYSQTLNAFVGDDYSIIDMRTNEQRDYDEAMAELDKEFPTIDTASINDYLRSLNGKQSGYKPIVLGIPW